MEVDASYFVFVYVSNTNVTITKLPCIRILILFGSYHLRSNVLLELERAIPESFEEYVKLEFPSMTTIVYYDTSGVDINELYGELFEAVDNCGYDMNLVVFLETDEPEIEGFDHNQIASYIEGNTYDELMAVGKPAPY